MNDEAIISPRIKHIPLRPARSCTPREGMFLALWQEYMAENPGALLDIARTSGPVRQRAASVAASFMTYMGCNCGMELARKAEDLVKNGAFCSREDAYLSAWAILNKRVHGINHGVRMVESMLATKNMFLSSFPYGIDYRRIPVVSLEDMDVLEGMAIWWSTEDASIMRKRVEVRMEALQEQRNKEAMDISIKVF